MPEGGVRGRYLLAAAIVGAIIVYGSLYPFTFRHPADGARRADWQCGLPVRLLAVLPRNRGKPGPLAACRSMARVSALSLCPDDRFAQILDALKPVVLHPNLTAYDLLRHTAIWLAIAALVEAIGGTKRALLLFPLFVGSALAARILIVARILRPAELAGAGLALIAWIVLSIGGGPRLRLTSAEITDAVLALIMGGIIALMGTESRTTTPLSIAARLR